MCTSLSVPEQVLMGSDAQVDIQPRWARLLIKGKLLQLRLPCDVRPDQASARRAKITGHLLLIMPKSAPDDPTLDLACLRQRPDRQAGAHCIEQAIILDPSKHPSWLVMSEWPRCLPGLDMPALRRVFSRLPEPVHIFSLQTPCRDGSLPLQGQLYLGENCPPQSPQTPRASASMRYCHPRMSVYRSRTSSTSAMRPLRSRLSEWPQCSLL
jgi:hypothetical protein